MVFHLKYLHIGRESKSLVIVMTAIYYTVDSLSGNKKYYPISFSSLCCVSDVKCATLFSKHIVINNVCLSLSNRFDVHVTRHLAKSRFINCSCIDSMPIIHEICGCIDDLVIDCSKKSFYSIENIKHKYSMNMIRSVLYTGMYYSKDSGIFTLNEIADAKKFFRTFYFIPEFYVEAMQITHNAILGVLIHVLWLLNG